MRLDAHNNMRNEKTVVEEGLCKDLEKCHKVIHPDENVSEKLCGGRRDKYLHCLTRRVLIDG